MLRQAARLALNKPGDASHIDQLRQNPHLSLDLYSGPLGLALVHAAIASLPVEDAASHRQKAQTLLEACQREFEQLPTSAPALQPGGFVGVGAVIYTFATAGCLLDDAAMVEVATNTALRLLHEETLFQSTELDIVHGAAGALLSLLALETVQRHFCVDGEVRAGVLARARTCAAHLLAARRGASPRTWTNRRGLATTGFAHGAAGISCALKRLARRCGTQTAAHQSWIEAAREGEDFEQELFEQHPGQWRAHTHDDATPHLFAWCYGAPGVLLGRLESLGQLDEDGENDAVACIEPSLSALLDSSLTTSDHLCCGNLGRAWILMRTSQLLEASLPAEMPSTWVAEARQRADHLTFDALRLYKKRGVFGVSEHPDERCGLMKGGPGVALAFLAQAYPDRIPCILDLSPPRHLGSAPSPATKGG